MSRESVIALILGLVLGLFVGGLIGQRHAPTDEAEPTAQASADAPAMGIAYERSAKEDEWDESTAFEEEQDKFRADVDTETPTDGAVEIAALQQDNMELQQEVYDLLEWIDNNLPQGETRSPDSFRAGSGPVLTDEHRLNPEIATVLNLSSTASEAISAALAETYAAMLALRDNGMRIRQPGKNRINIKIPNLGEEGKPLQAELERILRAQMGDERYNIFMDANWADLEREFFYFGQARQSLRFRSYNDKKTGEPKMWYQDRFYFPQGEGNRIIYEHAGTSSNVPAGYESYIQWEF